MGDYSGRFGPKTTGMITALENSVTRCAVGDYSGRFGLINNETGMITAVEKSSYLQIGQLAMFSIFIHGAGKNVCANIIPEYGEQGFYYATHMKSTTLA